MKKHNCYENLKKIGRANWICNICGENMSLELLMLYDNVGKEEFDKIVNVIK